MAIYNVNQMANSFKNYGVETWSKSIELNSKMNFRGDFPALEEGKSTESFGDFLATAVAKVNGLQQDANVAMEKLASGESKNLHETLLAVERADIAFKQMNQVRLKVIDAYKEIMKMQI